MVVEDDPDTREILADFFASHGYDVKTVATAEAGLAELKGNGTDVVLSDNQLDGGHTGSWMLRRAYAEGLLRRVAAVMYTADDDPNVPRVVRVLHKPTALSVIEATAERAIDSARGRDLARTSATRLTSHVDDEMTPSSRQA
ncbi:MAG: response regulator [Labilithrix sp.]|nr:response regulator [Labilithrix sp.]